MKAERSHAGNRRACFNQFSLMCLCLKFCSRKIRDTCFVWIFAVIVVVCVCSKKTQLPWERLCFYTFQKFEQRQRRWKQFDTSPAGNWSRSAEDQTGNPRIGKHSGWLQLLRLSFALPWQHLASPPSLPWQQLCFVPHRLPRQSRQFRNVLPVVDTELSWHTRIAWIFEVNQSNLSMLLPLSGQWKSNTVWWNAAACLTIASFGSARRPATRFVEQRGGCEDRARGGKERPSAQIVGSWKTSGWTERAGIFSSRPMKWT